MCKHVSQVKLTPDLIGRDHRDEVRVDEGQHRGRVWSEKYIMDIVCERRLADLRKINTICGFLKGGVCTGCTFLYFCSNNSATHDLHIAHLNRK